MAQHLFIVLEGVDGCGKTTISKELAAVLGATLVKTPLPDQEQLRRAYDNEKAMTARYLFYLSCVVMASQHIAEILRTNDVVCDRYLHSAICYHGALGVETDLVDINRLGIILPDLTFCLVADSAIRRLRLAARAQEEGTMTMIDREDFLDVVQSNLSACADYVIDTTKTSAQEAAAMIASRIIIKI